jgi:N-methylhydantoinase B/oxoprolinase/acetone carboxylase alpha subunit
MNETVHVDKASVEALTETMRVMSKRNAELEADLASCRRERDEARALLAHYKTSLAEKHNDPMQDGGNGNASFPNH